MKKALFVTAFLVTHAAHAQFVPPGGLSSGTTIGGSNGQPMFNSQNRIVAPLSNPTIYAGQVATAAVASAGAYAPADLPVTLTFTQNNSGPVTTADVSSYTAVSARVVAAGNACPTSSVYTIASTGTKIIVSDGDGLSGSVITVSVGGSASASSVPANPVTVTSSTTGCTPPQFSVSWGVGAISLTRQGWGYTTAPTGTGSASTATDAAIASISTTIGTGLVNLGQSIAQGSDAAAAAQSTANSATTAAAAAQTTASAAIPLAQKGVASGVAGLDTSGNVTAPISTTNLAASGNLGAGTAPSGQHYIVQGLSASVDSALLPSTFLVGGVGEYDAAPVKITSPLIGHGDHGGCVLNVQDALFEQFGRCGAGLDEAVVGMFKTVNNSPLFEAGADITSAPSGTVYTVVLNGTSVTVTPALSAADQKRIYPHTRIYSNVRNGMLNTAAAGQTDTPAIWYGYVSTITSTSTATTINVTIDPDSGTGGWMLDTGTTTTTAPGANSGDVTDTYMSAYTHPAVFIGASGKRFILNTMLQLDPTVKDSVTRAGEGEESDLQTSDPDGYHAHDKFFTIHGKTIVLTGKDLAADDSYLMRLAGSSLIPMGLDVDGIEYGGQVIHTDAGYQYYSLGDLYSATAGTGSLISQVGAMNYNGTFASLLMYGWKNANTTSGWGSNAEFHLGMQEKVDSGVMSGTTIGCTGCTSGGQIVWNPSGYHYGIGLGAGIGGTVNYGLYVDSNGYSYIPNSLTFLHSGTAQGALTTDAYGNLLFNGANLVLEDATKGFQVYGATDLKGATTATAITASSLTSTGAATAAQVNVGAVAYASLTTSAVVGTEQFCTDCYSSSNASKTLGIPVWWNGTTFVDALGQTAQH